MDYLALVFQLKRFDIFATLDGVFAGYTIMILYICTTKLYLNLSIYNM